MQGVCLAWFLRGDLSLRRLTIMAAGHAEGASPFTVRSSTEKDVASIMSVVNAAYSVEKDPGSGEGALSQCRVVWAPISAPPAGVSFKTGDRFTEESEVEAFTSDNRCLVAVLDGAVVGCICWDALSRDASGACVGEFGPLAVSPAARGKGIARALVRAVEDVFLSGGASASQLSIVDCRTDLPPFYAKLGYTETDRVPVDASLPQYRLAMANLTRPIAFVKYAKSLSSEA